MLPDSSPISSMCGNLGRKPVDFAPGRSGRTTFMWLLVKRLMHLRCRAASMFVNLGTVQAAETEAQLAGVMAHEISHVVMRHSTCNLTKQQTLNVGPGLRASWRGRPWGIGRWARWPRRGLGWDSLAFTKMSRDYEKQADLLGTGILYDAGYDPRGMPQFFETIQAKYGEGGTQLLSDHPNPGNRMQYVTAEIATLPPRQNPKVTSAEFTRVHALAMKARVYNAKEVQAGAWRQTGYYAAVAGGPPQIIPVPGAVARLSRSAMGLNDSLVTFQGRIRGGLSVELAEGKWQKWQRCLRAAERGRTGRHRVRSRHRRCAMEGWREGCKFSGRSHNSVGATIEPGQWPATGESVTSVSVSGRPANSIELSGKSPVVDGGGALAERDWLVTVARPDGDLNYMLFIAPEPDFETIRPVFNAMLQSFQVR